MMAERRGGVAVIVALALTLVLLVVAALVIDLGYARLVQAQLQTATDAAALAGASRLDLSDAGLARARASAVAVGALNLGHGEPVLLDANAGNGAEGDVVLGIWDEGSGFVPSLDPDRANAVRVRTERDDLVPMVSRAALGRDRLGAGAMSIALRGAAGGASGVPYYLPFGLPGCLWDGLTDAQIESMTFALNPPGVDNTGWAALGSVPSASWISSQLDAIIPCMHQWAEEHTIDEACVSATTSQSLNLTNGEIASGIKSLADAIESDGLPWDEDTWGALPGQHAGSDLDPSAYGNMIIGPVPVFDGGADYCSGSGGSWTGNMPMLGFAWGAIYDVKSKGAAASKNIWLKLDMTHVYPVGDWTGGGDYGVISYGPALVVR